MDEKRAYQILQLQLPASKQQAKKAYRSLAKKYHPDVWAAHETSGQVDMKMKEINLAFRFLLPRLPDEVPVETEPVRQEVKKKDRPDIPKQKLADTLFLWVNKVIRAFAAGPKREQSAGDTVFSSSPSQKKHKRPQFEFDDILKACSKKTSVGSGYMPPKPGIRRQKSSYKRYRKYIRSYRGGRSYRARRSGLSPIEPVGKIEPVSPVPPVTRD